MKVKSILVPVDYSSSSGAALGYAAELAGELGASLNVVHVWDRPTYVSDTVMVHEPTGGRRSLIDMIRENAELEMKAFLKAQAVPESVKLEWRLLSGDPTGKILEAIKAGSYDLMIVGTHGRTGLRHVLLGSVAEKLVRLSPIPVLTVPRPR